MSNRAFFSPPITPEELLEMVRRELRDTTGELRLSQDQRRAVLESFPEVAREPEFLKEAMSLGLLTNLELLRRPS